MQLQNSFTEHSKALFIWHYACMWCGQSKWSDLHHILGRCSASILNASTLHNNVCHIGNGKLATFEVQSLLLKKTFDFLQKQKYVLTVEDIEFINKHKKHYATFLPAKHIKHIDRYYRCDVC